ncbi:unnamed protein product [Nyctereutes procyonoides]|uniref:(raccoon dog) hypothetical protein n=1 Tax=Nyctereutes procyonoides TaxID=34880 RepID=A0A811ZSD1_NYCPR|nr:unnamed protein product [Nyctereutes procyonoides]
MHARSSVGLVFSSGLWAALFASIPLTQRPSNTTPGAKSTRHLERLEKHEKITERLPSKSCCSHCHNHDSQTKEAESAGAPAARAGGDRRQEDGSPIGLPSLLGPPPVASGKPGDPKSAPNWNPPPCPPSVEWISCATWMNLTKTVLSERSQTNRNADSLHRGPPGSRGPRTPPLEAAQMVVAGGGANTEPPFPGPGHGGPSRGGFHKEQRKPQRLKSWSLIKNTCPPNNGPQDHCRYEDLCAFYHPGAHGPPL